MTRAKEITWTEIVTPPEIVALVRPAIAKRIAWLEGYAGRPTREGKLNVDYQVEYWQYRQRMAVIEQEIADAYNRCRFEFCAWALGTLPMLSGDDSAGVCFIVDGVRIEFRRGYSNFHVALSGDGWRRLKAERERNGIACV